MAEVYAVVGDDSKTIAVQLIDDNGVAADLTGESITLRMELVPDGTLIEVDGLTGDDSGNVSAVIPEAKLLAGAWALDWRVVDGATYPGKRSQRPVLVVRPDVDGLGPDAPVYYLARPAVDGTVGQVLAIADDDPFTTEWTDVSTPSVALDDLTDVTITTPVTGNALVYNGSAWANAVPAGGGDMLKSENLSGLANAATARTNLGLGSAATTASTAYDPAGSAAAAQSAAIAASQPVDADLTTIAAANNGSVLAATTASFTTADESKLDGIEALADVTDATNVAAAGAVMEADTSTASMSFVIDEDNMATDSATKVPTQQSTKAYADTKVPKATFPDSVTVALSDMTTQITATGNPKAYWVNPFDTALTITKVKATLATAGSGSTVVDINEGAGAGTSILSTKITIEASETDSDDATTQPVISDTSIAADGRLTFDIDTAGTSAAGLQVTILFTRAV